MSYRDAELPAPLVGGLAYGIADALPTFGDPTFDYDLDRTLPQVAVRAAELVTRSAFDRWADSAGVVNQTFVPGTFGGKEPTERLLNTARREEIHARIARVRT